jgi:hypothetical protein
MKDPIVEEVRKARQDHAREFNHDLSAICKDLKRIERECGHKLVSLPPRLLTKTSSRPPLLAAEA